MKSEWLEYCLKMAAKKPDFYSGSRKVIRGQVLVFENVEDDLTLKDCGYTSAKMKSLIRGYINEEGRTAAQGLWRHRLGNGKYGSVGFSTYNHLIKAKTRSRIGSVMGPCIQSVCLTLLPDHRTSVDVFYRTTELFKKFPADLVFLHEQLLDGFDVTIETINCYFANVTVHPMYFAVLLPSLDDPVGELQKLLRRDPRFHTMVVKWTSKYLCPEHRTGIEKYSQAMSVHRDVNRRLKKSTADNLRQYLRDHL